MQDISKIFSTPGEEKKYDALMVSTPNNIGYLSDFWGSFGRLFLLSSGKKILISDSRYSQSAQKICSEHNITYIEICSDTKFWKNFFKKYQIKKLGIEAQDISLERYAAMKKNFCDIELIETSGVIEKFRLQKSEDEIKCLQKAAQIGDSALATTVAQFAEGITEQQLAWIFEKSARENFGAQGLSFDVIVAFGENSAVAHHHPTDKKLEKNMPILIDCGVKYKKYCSDLTRCFWFGEKKGSDYAAWKKTYELVHHAQKAGIEKYIPGKKIADADIAARKIFKDQEKFYIHSLGHGVGVDIHEEPGISSRVPSSKKFLENMVVTAEPGLYYPEKFGIRIEDLLVVRKNGAEFLSTAPYFFE